MNIQLHNLINDTQSALSAAKNRYGFFNTNESQKSHLEQTLNLLNELKQITEGKLECK